jgi:hypothetical protein
MVFQRLMISSIFCLFPLKESLVHFYCFQIIMLIRITQKSIRKMDLLVCIYYESHRTVESHQKFVYRPLPQTSTTTPTYFCMFTIHVNSQLTFNCNCYQEPDWLFKIRIVNMQKYVGAVVDVCGSGRYTNFLCDSTVR